MLVRKLPGKTPWMVDMELWVETHALKIKKLETEVEKLTDTINKMRSSRILGFFINRILKNAETDKK